MNTTHHHAFAAFAGMIALVALGGWPAGCGSDGASIDAKDAGVPGHDATAAGDTGVVGSSSGSGDSGGTGSPLSPGA